MGGGRAEIAPANRHCGPQGLWQHSHKLGCFGCQQDDKEALLAQLAREFGVLADVRLPNQHHECRAPMLTLGA